ncbi:MAG: hypothetical protein AMS27_12525 [Bacteroides sp. SM23_62_1]|nr:MAG: hypothetical protein AMS27_12525 [Bacteroides sp. SM23_62_1]
MWGTLEYFIDPMIQRYIGSVLQLNKIAPVDTMGAIVSLAVIANLDSYIHPYHPLPPIDKFTNKQKNQYSIIPLFHIIIFRTSRSFY